MSALQAKSSRILCTKKLQTLIQAVFFQINWQDRRKVTFPGSAYPKEIPQQCTPATHTEAVHCQRVLLGVFHPYLWPLKAPRSTLGEGRQTYRQPADARTPSCDGNFHSYQHWTDVKLSTGGYVQNAIHDNTTQAQSQMSSLTFHVEIQKRQSIINTASRYGCGILEHGGPSMDFSSCSWTQLITNWIVCLLGV